MKKKRFIHNAYRVFRAASDNKSNCCCNCCGGDLIGMFIMDESSDYTNNACTQGPSTVNIWLTDLKKWEDLMAKYHGSRIFNFALVHSSGLYSNCPGGSVYDLVPVGYMIPTFFDTYYEATGTGTPFQTPRVKYQELVNLFEQLRYRNGKLLKVERFWLGIDNSGSQTRSMLIPDIDQFKTYIKDNYPDIKVREFNLNNNERWLGGTVTDMELWLKQNNMNIEFMGTMAIK